jgi:predicted transcriptional regulator
MRVLLSIRPPHVDNILNGSKRYEYRRSIFARRDITTILVYCTKPVGLIVAEFELSEVIQDAPESLWERTSEASGISKKFFDSYFEGKGMAYALSIGEVHAYDQPLCPFSIVPNFTPPQSYRYLDSPAEHLPLLENLL